MKKTNLLIMSDINNKTISRTRAYFIYLIIILMVANAIDAYTTIVNGMFPSKIAEEFLSGYSTNEQNFILALGASIATIGYYFVFINLYLADKIGRKKVLAFTILGLAITCFLMMLSTNYWQYVSFWILLYLFFQSDIWAIYINEESKKEKRAFYQFIIMIAGLSGALLCIILRSIFITETRSDWRAMLIFPIIAGIPLGIIILLTLKESSKYQQMKEEQSKIEKRSFKEDLKAIFQTENRKSYIALLFMSFIFGAATIWRNLFEKYLADIGTITQAQITIIFIWTLIGVLVAYLLNGFLADRIGRKPLMCIWSGLMPIGTFTWVIGAHDPQNAFLIVQIGFALMHIGFWGLLGILSLTTIEMLPTDRRGTGVGFRLLLFALGTTVGLLLSSIFILFFGLGTAFIVFMSAMFILIPIAYVSVKETKGVDLSQIK